MLFFWSYFLQWSHYLLQHFSGGTPEPGWVTTVPATAAGGWTTSPFTTSPVSRRGSATRAVLDDCGTTARCAVVGGDSSLRRGRAAVSRLRQADSRRRGDNARGFAASGVPSRLSSVNAGSNLFQHRPFSGGPIQRDVLNAPLRDVLNARRAGAICRRETKTSHLTQ